MRRFIISACCCLGLLATPISQVVAEDTVKLSSASWLGNLNPSTELLKSTKKAVEKALDAPIDAEQQCGEVRGDCVVRAAREWTVGGDRFREVVIYIHTVGQASNVIAQTKGKWPSIKSQ